MFVDIASSGTVRCTFNHWFTISLFFFSLVVQSQAPEAAQYETCYVTAHKGPCRVAAWSKDGQFSSFDCI